MNCTCLQSRDLSPDVLIHLGERLLGKIVDIAYSILAPLDELATLFLPFRLTDSGKLIHLADGGSDIVAGDPHICIGYASNNGKALLNQETKFVNSLDESQL